MGSPDHIITAEESLGPVEELLLRASVTEASHADIAHWEALAGKIDDWAMFVKSADAAHMSPLLSQSLKRLPEGMVPVSVLERLMASYHAVLQTSVKMYALFGELADVWGKAGIEVIPLKGIHLAEKIYGDIGLRHLSDIDLMVREEHVEPCRHIAENNGWRAISAVKRSAFADKHFGNCHPYKLVKHGVTIELHRHVHNRGSRIEIDIDQYWFKSVEDVSGLGNMRNLHLVHLVQHLCVHLHKHLTADYLKVRSFCDVREVLFKRGQKMDWDMLDEASQRFGCTQQVQEVLFLCSAYWGISIPIGMMSQCDEEKKRFLRKALLRTLRPGNGPVRKRPGFSEHKFRFSKLPQWQDKLRYVSDLLFPSMAYHENHYSIRKPWSPILLVVYPVQHMASSVSMLIRKVIRPS